MAFFTNSASLTYAGRRIQSNTVTGEIRETVSMTKTAVTEEYTADDSVSFVITLVNSGTEAVSGLTLTDDLGAYPMEAETLYPLAYTEGSLRSFLDGVPQSAPTVSAGPPLVISDVAVPAGGSLVLAYETAVTAYAPLEAESQITNTVTVTGEGIGTALKASATIRTEDQPELSVSKAVSPSVVAPGGVLSYSFEIFNSGNTAAEAGDDVIFSDSFEPVLTDVSVSMNGEAWTADSNYSYDELSGAFATLPGQITVPAASFAQNPDGTRSVTPGVAKLVIKGKIKTGA